MNKQTFADLGVSNAVVEALAAKGIREPFPVQQTRDAATSAPAATCSSSRRPGRARRSPSEYRSWISSRPRSAPERPRGGSHPRAGRSDRGGAAPAGACPRAVDRRGLRRRRDRAPVQARPSRPHPGGHSRPPGGPDRARRLRARSRPDPGARRGRPHARHGLPPGRRPHRRLPPARAADALLLGHPRGRRGRGGRRATPTTPAGTSTRPVPSSRADVDAPLRGRTRDSKLDALVRRAARRGPGRNLVFVRTKHGADRLVKRLRPRKASRRSPCTATSPSRSASGRWPASRPATSATLVATDVAARGLDIDDVGPRDQLRSARRRRRLRASRRPDRPSRSHRARHHLRDARGRDGRPADRARSPAARRVRAGRPGRRAPRGHANGRTGAPRNGAGGNRAGGGGRRSRSRRGRSSAR